MRGQPVYHRLRARMGLPLVAICWLALVSSAGWAEEAEIVDQPKNDAKSMLPPLPRLVPAPAENPTTPEKVALGRQLFFDPRLSGDNTMSCATCHAPDKAFGDGLPRAQGAGGKILARNSPTLWNVGFHSRLFWDGRAGNLEEQALQPIESAEEMNQNLQDLEQKLSQIPEYTRQFRQVFGTEVDRQGVARALAAFQRSLITGPTPMDRFLAGEKEALSESAQRGMKLFLGEAGCVRCHHGPLLSDGKFYRLGVSFTDKGLAEVSGKPEDAGKFRTPSLRNVAETGPYMHDGSLENLFDVVEFYYRRAPRKSPDGLPLDIEPLTGQSYSEIFDLVAFLESLSGETPAVSPPELPGLESQEATP